jgi:hypothetical protein
VTLPFPCGFCGQSSVNGKCKIGIGKGGKVSSACPLAYSFMISAAAKVSQTKPCTNVSITCKLCTEVHWKYNVHQHLSERHRGWQQYLKDDNDFLNKIAITNEEALGIPENKRGVLATASDSYDACYMNHLPSIQDHRDDSPRRLRTSHSADPSIPLPTFAL